MNRFKKYSVLLALFLVLALVATACGGPAPAPAPDEPDEPAEAVLKVGFVYPGPVGDYGWNYAHDLGRRYLEDQMPEVEVVVIADVAAGPDAERVMTELVNDGCDLIFTCSFGFMDFTINVAERFPDVIFMNNSGFRTAENAGTYYARMYQASYLSGIAAGMQTETGKLGYVAPFPISLAIRQMNAYLLGARTVNPDITVEVVWTGSFYDPGVEKESAMSLLDAGCDVIAQYQDSPAAQQAAQERGVWGIGAYMDMTQYAPEAVLTGPVWNWGLYYVESVQSVIAGTWEPHTVYWGGLETGVVDLAPLNANVLSQEAIDAVLEARAGVEAGTIDIFAGPLRNDAGEIVVPEGSTMTDAEKFGMDWFVEGVKSNL